MYIPYNPYNHMKKRPATPNIGATGANPVKAPPMGTPIGKLNPEYIYTDEPLDETGSLSRERDRSRLRERHGRMNRTNWDDSRRPW